MTNAETTLRAHLREHPGDTSAHLALADAMADAGDECGAILYRIAHDPENDDWRLQYASLLERETPQWVTCPECKGKCKVFLHAAGAGGVWRTCDRCNGTGEVIDTNRTDRAAFIRCQIELANMKPCEWCRNYKPGRINCATDCICKIPALERREQELRTRHRTRWLPKCQSCAGEGEVLVRSEERGGLGGGSWGPCSHCKGTEHAGDMHRGFLRSVEVPTLEDVLTIKPNTRFVGPRDWVDPTDFARTLFRGEFATCQAVAAKDRNPINYAGTINPFSWVRQTRECRLPSDLPAIMWDALKGDKPGGQAANLGNGWLCNYPTVSAASHDASTTLCDTLRALCEGET